MLYNLAITCWYARMAVWWAAGKRNGKWKDIPMAFLRFCSVLFLWWKERIICWMGANWQSNDKYKYKYNRKYEAVLAFGLRGRHKRGKQIRMKDGKNFPNRESWPFPINSIKGTKELLLPLLLLHSGNFVKMGLVFSASNEWNFSECWRNEKYDKMVSYQRRQTKCKVWAFWQPLVFLILKSQEISTY